MADKILVAKESFFYTLESGEGGMVQKGARYREGHTLPKRYSDFFKEDLSINEVDEAKRPVGRPRKSDDSE